MKDHDEIMAVILSQLRVSKLYWKKLYDVLDYLMLTLSD